MERMLIENCKKAADMLPGFEEFLMTGIPDKKFVTSLWYQLPDADQTSFLNETDHSKKLLAKIESYQRQYASVIQDMNQQAAQIRHQANTIKMLETMLDEMRAKRRSLEQKENIYDDFR